MEDRISPNPLSSTHTLNCGLAMQVRLEVAHQKANVKRVVLKQDAVIGRSAECSLRIASSLVSRQHCKFTISEESVLLRDLGSSNGTFLNGARLTPEQDYEVEPDSQLSVGGVMFVVRFDAPPPPAPLLAAPPGSTVDLPAMPHGKSAPKQEPLTAEWSPAAIAAVADKQASAERPSVPRSERNRPAARAPLARPEASDDEAATISATPEQMEAALTGTIDELPEQVAAVIEDDTLGDLTESAQVPAAEADEGLRSNAVEAVVVASEVAEQEVVAANAGDVIDERLLEPAGEPNSPFAFEVAEAAPAWNVGDGFADAGAAPEQEATSPGETATLAEPPVKKKKLFSLFGMFGRKKAAAKAEPAVVASEAVVAEPAGIVAAEVVAEVVAEEVAAVEIAEPIETFAEDAGERVTAMETVAEVEAAPTDPALGDDLVSGANAAPVVTSTVPAETAAPSNDEGFGDFLRQIGH